MSLCAAVLPVVVAANAVVELWQDVRASGAWRTDYFHSSKALDDETGFTGATLQLKALPALTDRIDGKVELRATNTAIGSGGATRIQVLEAYARVHFAGADLYLGKQIVAWGRADGINPTDNLTPRDFTVMLPFEDDQRFGTPAAKLDLFLAQAYTLTLFASPFFEPARISLPSEGFEATETRPAQSLASTSAGVKLDKTGQGIDWSVSYYRGFSLLPGAEVVSPGPAASTLRLHYDRITVLGADIARNYGRLGFRGELAYVDTADDAGISPSIRNPFLHWIIGVDRTFLANLNINLQFFQRRVRHHRDPRSVSDPAERATALLNALIDGQRDAVTDGVSFRIGNKWLNDTLEAEVFGAGHFDHGDAIVRPLVTYAFNDHWKGTLGADLYFGRADTQFGSLEANRGVFFELRYGF